MLEHIDESMKWAYCQTELREPVSEAESPLVREKCGSKAEVVTVRSIALELLLRDAFYQPGETYAAYLLRSDRIHGTPLDEQVPDDPHTFAQGREWWAHEILSLYIKHATQSRVTSPKTLMTHLDRSDQTKRTIEWLRWQGPVGADIVTKYREALGNLKHQSIHSREAPPTATVALLQMEAMR